MFAAAAVAAAAALTAISTTSTNGYQPNQHTGGNGSNTNNCLNVGDKSNTSNNTDNNASTSNNQNVRARPYMSWAQYASQRRNSMQRRKIEISKRLEKASNVNNNNRSNSTATNPNSKISNGPLTKQTTLSSNQNSLNSSIDKNNTNLLNLSALNALSLNLNTISDLSEDDPLIKELRTSVATEFLKLQQISKDNLDEFDENKINFDKFTFDNFNLLNNLIKGAGDDGRTQFDINEIGQCLLDFIQTAECGNLGINSNNKASSSTNNDLANGSFSSSKLIKLTGQQSIQSNSNANAINNNNISTTAKWDPKWLKKIRKFLCIPFTFITLILLLITNFDSNWIHFQDNQERAGLWAVCNKSIPNPILGKTESIESTTTIGHIFSYNTNYLISNEYNETNSTSSLINNNNTDNSILNKLSKKTKSLFHKQTINNEIPLEDCFSRFFLKEDGQLVVVAVSLVAILFHFIGLVLLFIGLLFVSSNRSLYYYHSAGECLVSSALLNGLDVLAFVTLVSSQIEQSYKYGYCFYINLFLAFLIFVCSSFLYMDDMVNEYRMWKVRSSQRNKRKSNMFMAPTAT